MVSMQRQPDCSELNPTKLEMIFDGLTSTKSSPEESVDAETQPTTSRRFVKNSGLVPYDSSSDDSDQDCVEIDSNSDTNSDSQPASPVFRIPPKKQDKP